MGLLELVEDIRDSVPASRRAEVLDDLKAPEITAHQVNGYQLLGGMVTLTLESTRVSYFEATPKPTRVIVGRLNLTAEGAVNLATQLYDFLLEHGAIKPRSGVQ